MYFIKIILVAILMFYIADTTLGANEECKDDPNAIIGCAGRCHRRCSDYQRVRQRWECPHVCIPACDCTPGFVYDSYVKRCVKPEDCSLEGLEGKN